MGAAAALYSAVCWATGKYGNGIPYPINLRAVFSLSGWLPCPRWLFKAFDFWYGSDFLTFNLFIIYTGACGTKFNVRPRPKGELLHCPFWFIMEPVSFILLFTGQCSMSLCFSDFPPVHSPPLEHRQLYRAHQMAENCFASSNAKSRKNVTAEVAGLVLQVTI